MTVTLGGTKNTGSTTMTSPPWTRSIPYDLTPGEADVVAQLIYSFTQSEKLQRHIKFLFSQGSLYLTFVREPAVPRVHSHDGGRRVLRI